MNTDSIDEYVTSLYINLLDRHPEPGVVETWKGRIESGVSIERLTTELLTGGEFAQKKKFHANLWVPPGHYYSPLVDTESVRHVLDLSATKVGKKIQGIEISREGHLSMWRRLLPHFSKIPFTDNKTDGLRYHYNNNWYDIGDASIYFAMLLEMQPKRIIEIGSGFSSACMLDTIDREFKHDVELTFIEPYPDRLNLLLTESDRTHIKLHEVEIQKVDLDVFRSLDAGDILFIDSTHVLKTGSDVSFELFEVLPVLKKGVIVHFHDIFWPFEYPRQWINDGRSWNELYALRAFLMYQDVFKILFFNDYAAKELEPVVRAEYPNFLINPGGGIWLEKMK